MRTLKRLTGVVSVIICFVVYIIIDISLRNKDSSPTDVYVKWEQFGTVQSLSSNNETHFARTTFLTELYSKFLDDVPLDFQRQILNGSPLSCYSGTKGIFPKKYKKLLKILAQYAHDHEVMTNRSTNTRTLIWWCPANHFCGGLADRLRGIAFALYLAIASHRRLLLYWESTFSESFYFKPNLIDWTDSYLDKFLHQRNYLQSSAPYHMFVKADQKYPFLRSLSIQDWQNYLNIIAGQSKQHVVIATNLMPSHTVKKFPTINQSWLLDLFDLVELSDHDLDDFTGLAFRYLFKLDSRLLEEVSKAKKALNLKNSLLYTAIHIRTGFSGVLYGSEIYHRRFLKGKRQWKAALECAISTADKFVGNNSLIFLATDSNVVKEMAVNCYGSRFKTLKNNLVHSDSIKGRRNVLKMEKEGILLGLVDLILLAESHVLVEGISGFSWLAGTLCRPLSNEHFISSTTC